MPIMNASTVQDLRTALCETLSIGNPFQVEFHCKMGCSIKRLKQSDQVQKVLIVKGIKSFHKPKQEYKHPFIIIGAGSFGLRQAVEIWRQKVGDYYLFDRKSGLGGDAWNLIANKTSKLQSEGPHYQLMWLPEEQEEYLPHDYGNWPSRQRIIRHFQECTERYGIAAHINLNTEVVDTIFTEDPMDFEGKSYSFEYKRTGDWKTDTQSVKGSCLTFYPGCLCVPHRKTWPGEDVFGGQIGYGFSNEFDYRKIMDQYVIMIGMGAFAAENCRTIMEFGGAKVYIIARHFNLLLPRCISWYVNQSSDAPPAAFILDAFKPMYDLVGWDAWKFFSVTANSDRTVATIRQYTRWGIGDATFLAVYWDRAEIIQGSVKRFKPRGAVLDAGMVFEDIDHVIKVIGFDGDFEVDRINHATYYHGFWPEADFRRWCISSGSAIDASRFGGTGLSPGGASVCWNALFFFQHPQIAKVMTTNPHCPKGTPNVELGSPGYHYAPREDQTINMMIGSCCPEIGEHAGVVDVWKKRSMWFLSPPEKFIEECVFDWYQYCELCRGRGDLRPFPTYPYDVEFLHGLTDQEKNFNAKMMMKFQAGAAEQQEQMNAFLSTQELAPNTGLSMEPFKSVLRARSRSSSPTTTQAERAVFTAEGEKSRQMLSTLCQSPRSATSCVARPTRAIRSS